MQKCKVYVFCLGVCDCVYVYCMYIRSSVINSTLYTLDGKTKVAPLAQIKLDLVSIKGYAKSKAVNKIT